MDIWYAHLSEADLMAALAAMTSSAKGADKKAAKTAEKNARKNAQKARTRDSLQALSKLAEQVDGQYRIVSQPPVVVPARDLATSSGMSADELADTIHEQFRAYRATLAGRSPSPARTIRSRRCRPQGRGCRQRRHPGVHRLVAGPRSTGPAVPAGQGSDRVGVGGPPAQEPLPPARRASRTGPADDAGRERHLPRLDQGRRRPTGTSTGDNCAT